MFLSRKYLSKNATYDLTFNVYITNTSYNRFLQDTHVRSNSIPIFSTDFFEGTVYGRLAVLTVISGSVPWKTWFHSNFRLHWLPFTRKGLNLCSHGTIIPFVSLCLSLPRESTDNSIIFQRTGKTRKITQVHITHSTTINSDIRSVYSLIHQQHYQLHKPSNL